MILEVHPAPVPLDPEGYLVTAEAYGCRADRPSGQWCLKCMVVLQTVP